jgi:hypothetical protein
MKDIRTPESWAELQAATERWAGDVSDEALARFVRALQLNWRETRSRDAWEQLQCLYEIQHQRNSR